MFSNILHKTVLSVLYLTFNSLLLEILRAISAAVHSLSFSLCLFWLKSYWKSQRDREKGVAAAGSRWFGVIGQFCNSELVACRRHHSEHGKTKTIFFRQARHRSRSSKVEFEMKISTAHPKNSRHGARIHHGSRPSDGHCHEIARCTP